MTKQILSKVVRAGRATVFLVGLAVMVGLLFGLAGAAFGANGGNFILGQDNSATAVTRLLGNVPGAASLQVNNSSTQAGTKGLGINVGQGRVPDIVNANAGKAVNLNADKVDGKEAADFLAKNEKAADADALDGKDSSDFLGKNEKASDSDKLDGKGSSAFAGFGESAYTVGGAVNPCAIIELASLSNVSVGRPSHIYASGSMVYFPGRDASSLKYGEITIELRDSANNIVASSGKMYGSTTGAEDIPLSLQGVLVSGTNPNAGGSPFVAQPGNSYTLRLLGRSSSGTCDNNNPPYMKDRVLSYVLVGSSR